MLRKGLWASFFWGGESVLVVILTRARIPEWKLGWIVQPLAVPALWASEVGANGVQGYYRARPWGCF